MTFSIVARDPRSGAFGVATATGGPAVGSLVPYARAGVGAIATQGLTNPYYGYEGLDLLAAGKSAGEVLELLTAADKGRYQRQCIIVDKQGNTAEWTGREIIEFRGAHILENVAVAGNMLSGTAVLDAMATDFIEDPTRPLEDRLLSALAAGLDAGGDMRGTRSAALKLYASEAYPAVDIRADLADNPVAALKAILAATRGPAYSEFFKSLPKRG